MTKENNLEKSSQDYKKSQYGSWYKKNAENKKKDQKEEQNSLLKKLKTFFGNSWYTLFSLHRNEIISEDSSFLISNLISNFYALRPSES